MIGPKPSPGRPVMYNKLNKTSVVTQYHTMSNSSTNSSTEYVVKDDTSTRRGSKFSRAASSRITPSSKELDRIGVADHAKQKVHLMHKDMQVVEDSIETLQIENAFLKKTIIGLRGAALGRYFTASDFFLKQLCMGEWKGLIQQAKKTREAEGAESLRTRDRYACEQRIGNLETVLRAEKEDHKKTYQLCEDLQARLDQAEGLIRAVTEQMSRHPLPHPQEVKVSSPLETTEYMKSRLHEILRDLDPQYIPPLSSPAMTAVSTKERLERLTPYQSQTFTPAYPTHHNNSPAGVSMHPPHGNAQQLGNSLPSSHRMLSQSFPQRSQGSSWSNTSSAKQLYASPSNCALKAPQFTAPWNDRGMMLFSNSAHTISPQHHQQPSNLLPHPHIQSSPINLSTSSLQAMPTTTGPTAPPGPYGYDKPVIKTPPASAPRGV